MSEQTLAAAPAGTGLLPRLAWRRLAVFTGLLGLWQAYALWLGNPLLLPTVDTTFAALWSGFASGELVDRTLASLRVLLVGYAGGVAVAALLASFAALSRWGDDALGVLTSMFNPLPAVALLPIALLWFGIGMPSIVFVIIHSVAWPLAVAGHTGFRSVAPTLRMAARNMGLSGPRFVVEILVPAAFPQILSGLRIGWAFAWRTLIAAELVFGTSSQSGGLGWFIYINRAQLETPSVFAGLAVIILIGLLVEGLLFRSVSRLTVQRWGQEQS
ncbi:ABC transporter permease [Radicibacter daui]|uniref:ABC transporter permease n=1 Tax=Radicibacter daui TaxID=3064829 RepID=UPI0040468CBA